MVSDTDRAHLATLRSLLHQEVLPTADWDGALRETARLAREALGASEALIAVWDEGAARWQAVTCRGHHVDDDQLPTVASRTVLDRVRATAEPQLSTAQIPTFSRTSSQRKLDVRSVLAAPIRFFRRGRGELPRSALGAVLYADRRGDAAQFSVADIELLRDIAALAERTLSLLHELRRVESVLAVARDEVAVVRGTTADAYRRSHYEPRDPRFVREVLEPLRRAAEADRVGILLLGPTGSGKTHLAQAFHFASTRRAGPFVVLDCGQVVSAEALGAELFGYAKKSGFAAPVEGRFGKARLADGGTLFIDEVGSLPLELQQRLLRLIQAGRYAPLGSAEEEDVDLQVVAAANQDLATLVREGHFREDLYWRLAEMVLRVPPLDERPADVPGFAEAFLVSATARFRRPDLRRFTPAALGALAAYRWRDAGNLRGLEQTVHRSVLLAPAGISELDVVDLAFAPMVCLEPPAAALPAPVIAPRSGERARTGAVVPSGTAEHGVVDDALPLQRTARGLHRQELLRRKLGEHEGQLAAIAADREVAAAFGSLRAVPLTTLRLALRELGLGDTARAAREGVSLADIIAALHQHRDGNAAAAALGLTRDQLAWRLRRAGLGVREVLRGAVDPG